MKILGQVTNCSLFLGTQKKRTSWQVRPQIEEFYIEKLFRH